MSKGNPNDAAFGYCNETYVATGLTKLEYFSIQILASVGAYSGVSKEPSTRATFAVLQAKALIAELNKESNE